MSIKLNKDFVFDKRAQLMVYIWNSLSLHFSEHFSLQ